MRFDVSSILRVPGGRAEFRKELDFSGVDFGGVCPAVRPVSVSGMVRNVAGMLRLTASVDADLSCVCDRCGAAFERLFHVSVERVLATRLEDEENDDILLLDGGSFDLDELMREAFVLNMDTRMLCREDCKGLCSVCGADLNVGACHCGKEPDPRWAALQKLL